MYLHNRMRTRFSNYIHITITREKLLVYWKALKILAVEQYYFLFIQKWDLAVSDVNMFSFSVSFVDTCGSKDFPFHNSYCAVKFFSL